MLVFRCFKVGLRAVERHVLLAPKPLGYPVFEVGNVDIRQHFAVKVPDVSALQAYFTLTELAIFQFELDKVGECGGRNVRADLRGAYH